MFFVIGLNVAMDGNNWLSQAFSRPSTVKRKNPQLLADRASGKDFCKRFLCFAVTRPL